MKTPTFKRAEQDRKILLKEAERLEGDARLYRHTEENEYSIKLSSLAHSLREIAEDPEMLFRLRQLMQDTP